MGRPLTLFAAPQWRPLSRGSGGAATATHRRHARVRLARRILNEKIVVRENGKRVAITRREAMLKQLANTGIMGDLRSIREVLNLDEAGAAAEIHAEPITRIELVPVEPVPYRLRYPDAKPGEAE
jgi:hypothetical protein